MLLRSLDITFIARFPDNTLFHNGKFEKSTGYCTDLFFAQALQWMKAKHEARQPFFAYIPLNAAHGPHVVPEAYYKHYLGKPGVSEDTAKFLGMVENIDTNFGTLLAKLRAAYDQWWADVQPLLVNEAVANIPKINPFQELYYRQFGGCPTPADLKRMDPTARGAASGESNGGSPAGKRRERRKATEDAPGAAK